MIVNHYTVYGYTPARSERDAVLGYCGSHRMLRLTGYLSGNGTRWYSPSVMRFHSPDVLSPFRLGGLNAYAYCGGDPIGYSDPSGGFRIANTLGRLRSLFGLAKKNQEPDVFIGYHGTSAAAGRKIIQKGVRKDASSFFVTDRYESAKHYARLQDNGVVVKVMARDLKRVVGSSARGVKRDTGINELKIDRPAFRSLKFSFTSEANEVSDFSRFMTQQERLESTIHNFRLKATRRGN